MRKKPRKYFVSTFRQEIWFMIGWSREEFDNYMERNLGGKPELGMCFGTCMLYQLQDDYLIILWVPDKRRKDIITHESVHAANYILDMIGNKSSHKNDEVQAYLTQEIFNAATRP